MLTVDGRIDVEGSEHKRVFLREAAGFGGGFHWAGEVKAGLWAVDVAGP